MTEDEALARLAALKSQDPEGEHISADELMTEALRACGWGRLADAYLKARHDGGWWFA